MSTGNANKIVYYDAFWRPVVTREFDAANPAATTRFTRDAYDVMGRMVFASYPGTTDALTAGTHTAYDPLNRPTRSTQDSEQGALTTTTQYLGGFQTKVTNPRGFATTSSYQVFGSPDTGHPTTIASPEGVTTTITRDVFGKPLTETRSGPGG